MNCIQNKKLLFIPILIFLILSCKEETITPPSNINYREEMRVFVKELSSYSKNINPNFMIIPQNGQELLTENGEGYGVLKTDYLNAIDATGRESMFYGYYNDDEKTPEEDKLHLLNLCKLCEKQNVEVLTTDYCSTHSKMDDSYSINNLNGFISFAANHRGLNNIPDYPPTPFNENENNITKISEAKNFLYLINGENFNSKEDFISAVSATNYDLIIMDLFHNEVSFTKSEIEQLKKKENNATRLVVCYMSIGEAENYRYYWDRNWSVGNPSWLANENPNWAGNYKVKYWDSRWKNIIFGNDNSYLKKILDAGFDGVYLDIIDAFEYFEEN